MNNKFNDPSYEGKVWQKRNYDMIIVCRHTAQPVAFLRTSACDLDRVWARNSKRPSFDNTYSKDQFEDKWFHTIKPYVTDNI